MEMMCSEATMVSEHCCHGEDVILIAMAITYEYYIVMG